MIVFVLSGCAQFARQRQQEALQKAMLDTRQGCAALFADPELDPIRGKVALYSPEQQTFAMRTNTDHVTAEEKPVIALWTQKRDQCEQIAGPMLAMFPAQMLAVTKAAKQVTDSLIAELYLGYVTYGELANKRAKNAAELMTTLANIEQALLVQNQQAQFQAQQLANQAIANWNAYMQTQAFQQMQRQMSLPVTCTSFGNITQCQ
jgi:hypothetical protein